MSKKSCTLYFSEVFLLLLYSLNKISLEKLNRKKKLDLFAPEKGQKLLILLLEKQKTENLAWPTSLLGRRLSIRRPRARLPSSTGPKTRVR
jgi:hypothetical protein